MALYPVLMLILSANRINNLSGDGGAYSLARKKPIIYGLLYGMYWQNRGHLPHMLKSHLDIHGVKLLVSLQNSAARQELHHDFSCFLIEEEQAGGERFELVWRQARERPHWVALYRTGRSRFYIAKWGGRRVSFFDRAWVEYQYWQKHATIYCDDPKVGYEVLYMTILSYAGEALDQRGIHKIHGLGISFKNMGGLLLAPSGTGKSTLLLELLCRKDIGIMSDDTPLVRGGRMLAFPQRIAIREFPAVDSRFVRKFSRVEYGEKYVVGSDFFRAKIQAEAAVKWLFIVRRGENTAIVRMNRTRIIWPLTKWLVFGYETVQIRELFIRCTPRDLWARARILLSRSRAAVQLFCTCDVYGFSISGSNSNNADTLLQFLENNA